MSEFLPVHVALLVAISCPSNLPNASVPVAQPNISEAKSTVLTEPIVDPTAAMSLAKKQNPCCAAVEAIRHLSKKLYASDSSDGITDGSKESCDGIKFYHELNV